MLKLQEIQGKSIDDLLISEEGKKINTAIDWDKKKAILKERILWSFGESPPGATNSGPKEFDKFKRGRQDAS